MNTKRLMFGLTPLLGATDQLTIGATIGEIGPGFCINVFNQIHSELLTLCLISLAHAPFA